MLRNRQKKSCAYEKGVCVWYDYAHSCPSPYVMISNNNMYTEPGCVDKWEPNKGGKIKQIEKPLVEGSHRRAAGNLWGGGHLPIFGSRALLARVARENLMVTRSGGPRSLPKSPKSSPRYRSLFYTHTHTHDKYTRTYIEIQYDIVL